MSDEKTSLLKPYTNYDRIKNMTVDEMAIEFASPFSLPSFCDLCDKTDGDNCVADKDFSCDIYYRKSLMKQWLESEAER